MKKSISILLAIFLGMGVVLGQDSTNNTSWKLYPTKNDTAHHALKTDTIYTVKKSEKPGKVTVSKDGRIDKISRDLAGGESQKPKAKGYRIQVISSSTKSVVDAERAKLIATHRQHKTYIDYKAPNFRLRVGNFRTRLEAEKMQHEIKEDYPNTLIVTDLIDFPVLEQ